MIGHLVASRWREGTTAADIASIDAAMRPLHALTPGSSPTDTARPGMRDSSDDVGAIAVLDYPDVANRPFIHVTINHDQSFPAARCLTAETVDHLSERKTA